MTVAETQPLSPLLPPTDPLPSPPLCSFLGFSSLARSLGLSCLPLPAPTWEMWQGRPGTRGTPLPGTLQGRYRSPRHHQARCRAEPPQPCEPRTLINPFHTLIRRSGRGRNTQASSGSPPRPHASKEQDANMCARTYACTLVPHVRVSSHPVISHVLLLAPHESLHKQARSATAGLVAHVATDAATGRCRTASAVAPTSRTAA